MAPIAPQPEKDALRRDLDLARHRLGRDAAALRRGLDVGAVVRASVVNHRAVWLAGAGLVGWLAAALRPRRRPPRALPAPAPDQLEQMLGATAKATAWTGLAFAALKWLLAVVRPALAEMLKKKLADWARRR